MWDNMKKQIVVIGCGLFGRSIATTLEELGNEVMIIDKNEDLINNVSSKVTHAVVCDITVEGAMAELGLSNFDICVVAVGTSYEASIIATVEAKNLGIPKVFAKAKDDVQAMVLKRIGADRIIIPERDMGIRVAYNISSRNILDSINLSEESSLIEVSPIDEWIGKSIKDSDIRQKYAVNIVAIKNENGVNLNFYPDYVIEKEDILLIAGKNENIKVLL